jgi:hypothetical protein
VLVTPVADLVAPAYLQSVWDTGTLSAAQLASLAPACSAATRAVRQYCRRVFTRATFDELYTLTGPRSPVVLRQWPVSGVTAVMVGPTAALTVANADPVTNQRATVALATTGSEADATLVATGVTLSRWASGTIVAASVPFATSPTVGAVAAAIAGLGGGWTAIVGDGLAARASADFRPPQGAFGCLGPTNGADLLIHAQDAPFALDAAAGIVRLDPWRADDPWSSPRWGAYLETDFGSTDLSGVPGGVRVIYDAGFDAVPADVLFWTAQAAKSLVEQMATDTSLASERAGSYGWQARAEVPALPAAVRQGLASWVNPRA